MSVSKLSIRELVDSTVAILGFGRSGRAVCDFLLARGRVPTVYAQGEIPCEARAPYEARGVRFFTEFPAVFPERVLVRSPGLRPDIPEIARAVAGGAILTGECDLFLANTKAHVIGVTGSDGKTTTASIIAALLRAAGKRALLGGNNGKPLLPYLETLGERDFAVVELSSFQLMSAPSPEVAVLTNITPNHLNWHLDLTEYVAAKCRIFGAGAGRLVCAADDPITAEVTAGVAIPVTRFSAKRVLPPPIRQGDACVFAEGEALCIQTVSSCRRVRVFDVFSPIGEHNRQNLAAALGAVAAFADDGAIRRGAAAFCGVPHRIQTVATVGGVRYIDSSIDTSPTRVAATLAALNTRPLVIVGGRGKGIDLTPLADTLANGVAAVFAYGETADAITALIGKRTPTTAFLYFADAFRAAADAARAGDTVLLSPGCTAFGEFRDFEHRAEVFCRLVEDLERKNSGTEGTDPRDGGPYEHHGL